MRAAVNAATYLPVTASGSAGNVILTAKHAGAAGNEAQVTANQQTSSGGSQAQPQPGYDAAAPDAGSSGTNPWAQSTLAPAAPTRHVIGAASRVNAT